MGKRGVIVTFVISFVVLLGVASIFVGSIGNSQETKEADAAINEEGLYNFIDYEDVLLMEEDHYLVYFYQTSCTYCQQFEPTLKEYVELENALPVYTVDLEEPSQWEAWDMYQIEGTPTCFSIRTHENDTIQISRFQGVVELGALPTAQ